MSLICGALIMIFKEKIQKDRNALIKWDDNGNTEKNGY